MPRQRQRDRDDLDHREVEEGVDRQPKEGDEAEEAVVGQQEEDDQREAKEGGLDRAVEGVLPERRRDRRLVDQRELDRQRADAQELGQVLGLGDVEAARDLSALVARDAGRVLLEVDDRARDDLAVEDDGERVGNVRRLLGREALAVHARLLEAALGNALRDLGEGLLPLVGEVEGDVWNACLVEVLLRVSDLLAGQLGAVLEEEPPADARLRLVRIRVGIVRRRLLAKDHIALGYLLNDRALGLLVVELEVEVLLLGDGAGQELERVLVEEIELALVRAERLAALLEALRLLVLRCDHRVVEAVEGPLDRVGDVRVRRDYIRLEVVKRELRGLAHLIDRVLRILNLRQADRDLRRADPRDLGLRYA